MSWPIDARDAEGATTSLLGSFADWSQPPKQEKAASAKTTAIGKHNPVEGLLEGVANAYASKIDRPTMRTAG